MKKCIMCGEEKDLNKDNFQWRNDTKTWRNRCKICFQEQKKQYYQENKEKTLGQQKEYRQENKKNIKKRNQKYYQENKKELKEYRKEYYQENKKVIKEYHKEYYQENKENILEQKKKYEKNRRKNDPMFKLRKNISRIINHALNGKKNGKSILKYLPYTIEELKQNIESKFKPWMTWDNWGIYDPEIYDINPTWQIDHIIPQSLLPYDSMEHPNFQICWSLENLQPLDSKENLEKSNKL